MVIVREGLMVDLSVNLAGLKLHNPIIVASSPATEELSGILECQEAGAVVTKSIGQVDTSNPEVGSRRTHFGSRGFWATSTLNRETLPRDSGLRLVTEARARLEVPIIASAAATNLAPDSWVPLCSDLVEAGASALQLDLFYLPQPISAANHWADLLTLLDTVGSLLPVPVFPKLNIEMPAYLIARDFHSSHIDGLFLLDSVRTPGPINIHNKGRSEYQYAENLGMSSLFGPWQLPLTQHYTTILGRLTDYPLCVGGGLFTATDALEMIMLGATALQFATAVLLNGYGYIHELVVGISKLLGELGYDSITDVRGLALKNQSTDVETVTPIFTAAKAVIDRDKCTNCSACSSHCFCQAIEENDGTIGVNPLVCEGCGFCVNFCKFDAIHLVISDVSVEPESNGVSPRGGLC